MKVSHKIMATLAITVTLIMSIGIAALAAEGVVNCDALNIRGGNWTEAELLNTVPAGTGVHITGETADGWYSIFYEGYNAYVKKEYVNVLPGDAVVAKTYAGEQYGRVNASTLNVRALPSYDSNVCRQLSEGTKVVIRGVEGDFYMIENGDWNAYVAKEYIDLITYEDFLKEDPKPTGASGVVDIAMQYIGTPYRYGGSSPSGFDCSGFTSYVYRQVGVSLNRTAAGQAGNGVAVSRSELAPGDLVMFNTGGGGIGHVGIYVGGGNFIHSPYSGRTVCVESMNSGYYSSRFVCARRIL